MPAGLRVNPPAGIVLRDLSSLADFRDCVRLQRDVWFFPDEEIIPASLLVVLQRYGGISLGAFDASQMVGFVAGFLAAEDGDVFQHSHMLAVLPAYQGRRVGTSLKWAQRERVLEQALKRVSWTFDPLQAGNAHFNIQRLGAVAENYLVDLYGAGDSPLHGGLPTDRLEASWWIESERVLDAMKGSLPESKGWESLAAVNPTRDLGDGFRRLESAPRLDMENRELLIEVPANWNEMMAREPDLSRDWRLKARGIFQSYLPRYRVEGFHRRDGRCYYRLAKRT